MTGTAGTGRRFTGNRHCLTERMYKTVLEAMKGYNIARKAAVIRQHEVMICQLMVFGWEDGTVDSAMFCNVMKGYAKLW